MRTLVFDRRGKGGRLAVAEVAAPRPGRGEVLARVKAASLNAGDWRMLGLGFGPKSGIPGSDFAGVVEAVGAADEGAADEGAALRPGDAVVGDLSACGCGALAEFVRAPARSLARMPANIPFEEAAACPVAGVAALQALRDLGRIRSGDSVLIIGSSGGVGGFAVQLARHFGARVTAVCGAGDAGQARTLGAHRVIDDRETDLSEWGGPYDLAIAIHCGGSPWRYLRLLAANGRFVRVGGSLPTILASMALGPLLSLGRKKTRTLVSVPDVGDLSFVLNLVSEGALKPAIAAVYELADAPAAFALARGGRARGKIVVRIG